MQIHVRVPCLFLFVLATRLAAGGCIGRRFFQASSQATLLRDLRQKIQEVSDFHHTASQALRVPPPHTSSSDSHGDESPDSHHQTYLTSPQLHTELVRLVTNAYALKYTPSCYLAGIIFYVLSRSHILVGWSPTGCLVYLRCGWMTRLCKNRKCIFPLFLLSMNHTD